MHQLGDALHHLVPAQPGGALGHQLGHALAIAGALDHQKAQPGHRLGVIELQAPVEAPFRQQGRRNDQELVLLLGWEMHGKGVFRWQSDSGRLDQQVQVERLQVERLAALVSNSFSPPMAPRADGPGASAGSAGGSGVQRCMPAGDVRTRSGAAAQ